MLSHFAPLLLSVPFYLLCALTVGLVRTFRRGARPAWGRRALLAATWLAVYVASAPIVANAVIRRLEGEYAPPVLQEADRNPENLIVVLTAGWFRQNGADDEVKLGEDGWERLDAGVTLWRRIGGTLLFVGAPAPDGIGPSVAEAMSGVARTLDVPASALAVETRSRNTYENFTFSLPLLRAHADHLWLVTTAMHMPRAMGVASHLGLHPVPAPCFFQADTPAPWETWLPTVLGPPLFEAAMHEVIGREVYRWRGWAD